jgi:TonB family protein
MPLAGLVFAASLSLHAQVATGSEPKPVPCVELLSRATNAATVEICRGDEQVARAARLPKDSRQRIDYLTAAADSYRRAARLPSDVDVKVLALEALAGVYEAPQLNDAGQLEFVLFELSGLRPQDLRYVFRIAELQESRGLTDAAEITLLDARQRQPDNVEPYRMLAQFYARRATALNEAATAQDRQNALTGTPGSPDANGVYRVGTGLAAPRRKGVPYTPADASAAGIQGIVIVEVTIDEAGAVRDARVLRSVPLLDDAALKTVREWQFEPSVVNGRAVPVKAVVTVDFTRR